MYTRAATADDDGTKYMPGKKYIKIYKQFGPGKKCMLGKNVQRHIPSKKYKTRKNAKKSKHCQKQIGTRLLPHLVNIFLRSQVRTLALVANLVTITKWVTPLCAVFLALKYRYYGNFRDT